MAQKGIIRNTTVAEISAENLAAVFHSIVGKSGIVQAFNNLACTKLTDNSVQLDSGVYSLSGFLLHVETGTAITLTVDSGTAGQNRNDLVVAELVKNGGGTGIDTLQFKVVKGTSTSGTAVDPTLTQQDVNATGTTRQEALYRIKFGGVTLSTIETVAESIDNLTTGVTIKGENSNGTYYKYPDGTLVCTHRVLVNNALMTAEKNIYRWDFPYAFFDSAWAMQSSLMINSVNDPGSVEISAGQGNALYGNWFLHKKASLYANAYASLLVIGRWK